MRAVERTPDLRSLPVYECLARKYCYRVLFYFIFNLNGRFSVEVSSQRRNIIFYILLLFITLILSPINSLSTSNQFSLETHKITKNKKAEKKVKKCWEKKWNNKLEKEVMPLQQLIRQIAGGI